MHYSGYFNLTTRIKETYHTYDFNCNWYTPGCPYKVLSSQWVPTRPEAMQKTKNKWKNVKMLHDHDELLNHVSSNPQEIFCYPDKFECINKCCQHKYWLQITTWGIFCPNKKWFFCPFPRSMIFFVRKVLTVTLLF